MSTTRDTVRQLSQSIITRLENKKAIEVQPELRAEVVDEVNSVLGPHILTEQDLRDQALERIGASSEALSDNELNESEQFRTARSMVRKTFGDDELRGLFYQKSIRDLADKLLHYLMESSKVEEVYASDDDIRKFVVQFTKDFNPAELH